MATTTIIPIHQEKSNSIKETIYGRIDYIENPLKTNNHDLVTAYLCSPESADIEFIMTKSLYESTHNNTNYKNNVLAYHVRQAFKPGEIDVEKAHRLGEELAYEFTKGEHEFVVATHVDKNHIHNHIIFNSTQKEGKRKFNNQKNSAKIVREISDRLCIENDLSVVQSKNEKGQHYKEWQEDKKGMSWKTQLKNNINDTILESLSFEDFIEKMKSKGYEIKRGKYISFKAPGQERFTRAKTLGDNYAEENIIKRIFEKSAQEKTSDNNKDNIFENINVNMIFMRIPLTQKYIWISSDNAQRINMNKVIKFILNPGEKFIVYNRYGKQIDEQYGKDLYANYIHISRKKNVDIENNTIKMNSSVYSKPTMTMDKKVMYLNRRQHINNVQSIANTLLFLNKEKIFNLKDFEMKIDSLQQISYKISDNLKQANAKLASYCDVMKYLVSYNKYKDINEKYQSLSLLQKKKYFSAHEQELLAFNFAKEKLESSQINLSVSVEKMQELIQSQEKTISNISSEYKQNKQNIDSLKNAYNQVKNISGKEKKHQKKRTYEKEL